MRAIQVYDGDGVSGKPTVTETERARRDHWAKKVDIARQLAIKHKIEVTNDAIDQWSHPPDSANYDAIIVHFIEEKFGPIVVPGYDDF